MQRRYRLSRSADFERVRVEGRQWRHPLVTMAVAANALTHNRYGFVVTRRLGSAVIRNRVRRRLREAVRLALPHLQPGHDVVFIARNEIADQPYNKIERGLHELFRRAKLWRDGNETDEGHRVRPDPAV